MFHTLIVSCRELLLREECVIKNDSMLNWRCQVCEWCRMTYENATLTPYAYSAIRHVHICVHDSRIILHIF